MIDATTALRMLAEGDPLADPTALGEDELAFVASRCEDAVAAERRVAGTGQRAARRADWVARPRPAWALVAAFVATAAVVVLAVILGRDAGTTPDIEPRVTTTFPSTSIEVDGEGSLSIVSDVTYATSDAGDLTMTVFRPTEGDGPWPLIVAYSPYCIGCDASNLARILALRGAVVAAPVWETGQSTPEQYIDGATFDRAACAVGMAQAMAPAMGADPQRTFVLGDWGGEHPAAWSALGLARTSPCLEDMRAKPIGLVIGTPQWIFQQDIWDDALGSAELQASDTLDRFVDIDRWRPADDLAVFVWSAATNANERQATREAGWLARRDASGSLVADLDAIGAFDDGSIGLEDDARLASLLFARAGLPVSTHLDDRSTFGWNAALYDEVWSFIEKHR